MSRRFSSRRSRGSRSSWLKLWRNGAVAGLALISGLFPTAATAQPEATCRAELSRQIEAITVSSEARWGILAESLEPNPRTIYAQNADQLFIPASNVKLLTTAAALTVLGDEFRIRTSVYQLPSEASSQEISLRVVGRGDPSLTDIQLRQIARQIAERGIQQIDRLEADDQYFQGVFSNPTWEQEDIEAGYGAPFNSLILNQNAIGLTLIPQAIGQRLGIHWDDPTEAEGWQIVNRSTTVAPDGSEFLNVGRDLQQPILRVEGQLRAGSAPEPVAVSIPDPASYFLTQFQQALAAEQIQVQQSELAKVPIADMPETDMTEISAVESAPLNELLIETNQQSNNLYAEALLRQLGKTPEPAASPMEAGIARLQSSLTQLGVRSTYQLADGSGLSRQNQASPQALVETLQAMHRSRYAEAYRNSLATAGVSGTLAARFKHTPVQGQFAGKTGSLRGVVALSGYLQDPSLAVSILTNAEAASANIQPQIDAVLKTLKRWGSC